MSGDHPRNEFAVVTFPAPHGTEARTLSLGDVVAFGRGSECGIRFGYAPRPDHDVPRIAGHFLIMNARLFIESSSTIGHRALEVRTSNRTVQIPIGEGYSPRDTRFDVLIRGAAAPWKLGVTVRAQTDMQGRADTTDPPTTNYSLEFERSSAFSARGVFQTAHIRQTRAGNPQGGRKNPQLPPKHRTRGSLRDLGAHVRTRCTDAGYIRQTSCRGRSSARAWLTRRQMRVPEWQGTLWVGPREDPYRYRIEVLDGCPELVGDGGEGIVYRACRTSDLRDIALKMVTAITPDDYERFSDRAAALSEIDNPHVMVQIETFVGLSLDTIGKRLGRESEAIYSAAGWIPGRPFDEAITAEGPTAGLHWVGQIAGRGA